jgi:hypothetical protein
MAPPRHLSSLVGLAFACGTLVITISPNGHHPVWSPDGAEFLYTPGNVPYLHAVQVTTRTGFAFSEPARVPRPFRNRAPQGARPFDIGRDGRRFVGLTYEDSEPEYHVVVNWFEELRRRVPVP